MNSFSMIIYVIVVCMDVYCSFVYNDSALFITKWRWGYKEGNDQEGRVGTANIHPDAVKEAATEGRRKKEDQAWIGLDHTCLCKVLVLCPCTSQEAHQLIWILESPTAARVLAESQLTQHMQSTQCTYIVF
jgi:hypothetical protein